MSSQRDSHEGRRTKSEQSWPAEAGLLLNLIGSELVLLDSERNCLVDSHVWASQGLGCRGNPVGPHFCQMISGEARRSGRVSRRHHAETPRLKVETRRAETPR